MNARAQSLRAFGRWLLTTNRSPRYPFFGLALLNEATDRRRVRRALTVDETERLIRTARTRPLAVVEARKHKLSDRGRAILKARGEHRALIYAVAAGTGLRRGECTRVRWCDLDLEDGDCAIPAASAKARRAQSVPLSSDVLLLLQGARKARHGEPGDVLVFPPETMPNPRTFARDLEAAGIKARGAGETVVDFHALRVTLGTRLSDANVPLVQAQRILRHSTPTLTANKARVLRPARFDGPGCWNRCTEFVPRRRPRGSGEGP